MLLLSAISIACKAQILGSFRDVEIKEISTDSRKITEGKNTLFVAIITAQRNGHLHIKDAYNNGVRAFLVSENNEILQFADASFLVVENTVKALQLIAQAVRAQFIIPVIGITGSNGKTIVKEWLYQLLGEEYKIVRSPKSFNSQIGVPLSVWQMNEQHNLGIFEAGISEKGEMEKLEKIIQPSIGIFTNIGEAHNQGFASQIEKVNEKLLLFNNADWLIYNEDYPAIKQATEDFQKNRKSATSKPLQLFGWSFNSDAMLQILKVKKEDNHTNISARYKGETKSIVIPFSDAAAIENAIHCWCVLLLLDTNDEVIASRMKQLNPIAMRLEMRQGEHNCIIINDAYNSDFTSLSNALDFLHQQKQQQFKTLVLSDIHQSGLSDADLYKRLFALLQERKINQFIGIGDALFANKNIFETQDNFKTFFFRNTEKFLKSLQQFEFKNEAILLKGARSFAFEKISLLLEQKIHQTVLSVNLSAMRHNLALYRNRLKPEVKTMAMVKAASYGSGTFEIANTLQDAKVDYLTVAYVDEGVDLRKANIDLPIMVMSPSTEAFDRMIVWKLEPEIFNLRSLQLFISVAKNMQTLQYPVHLKLDTGMHRLGFMDDEIEELLAIIASEPCLRIASIFSHLAASDDVSHGEFTHKQAALFVSMSQRIIETMGYRPLLHICNTAGIIQYPEYHFDMVRLGLGLYGIDSSGLLNNQLQQISTLRSSIAQIKKIKRGETIGYSRKGTVGDGKTIATICIGYADGYPRILSSNGAFVLINNKPAPLIGSIAMDMCMVDISHIEGVNEGDEVIIFGDALPIVQVAKWANTIPYEIMTNIAQRVKRVFVNEG